jgi:hypothetical protein
MHKNAMKCKQNTKQMVHKQAWSIKNYRYVWDVSGTWARLSFATRFYEVQNDSIEAGFESHPLYHVTDGAEMQTLQDAHLSFVQWPKKYIFLYRALCLLFHINKSVNKN